MKLILQVVKSYISATDKISLGNIRTGSEILNTNWNTGGMLTLYEIQFFILICIHFLYILKKGVTKFNRYAQSWIPRIPII